MSSVVRPYVAVLIILAGTQSTAASQREFEVLVPVPMEFAGSAAKITPNGLAASLGGRNLNVLSVQGRERASRTPVVVVLDLLHTADPHVARVAAEILPLLPELQRRGALVISTAVSKGLIETVYFGSGSRISVVRARAADLERIARRCRERAADCPGIVADYDSNRTKIVPALSGAFDASQAPVRVFWLSGDQVWWEAQGDRVETRPPLETNSWAVCLPNMSEAGISLFPIIMPDAMGSPSLSGAAALREATKQAAANGGIAAAAEAAPGEALRRLLEMTDNALVIRLSGPVTGFMLGTGIPRKLRIQSKDPARPLRFERPFVINPPGYRRDESLLKKAAVRVVLPSGDVHIEGGCGPRSAPSDDPRVTIQLPDTVMSAPAGPLETWVEYSGVASKGLAQRLTFRRPQRQGPIGAKEGVCLPLAAGSTAQREIKFKLVMLDETTGWVGAVNARVLK